MIGRLLYDLLLFLVPFAAYGLYWHAIGASKDGADERAHPWVLLTAVGLGLVAVSFVIWSLPEENTRGGVYIPPHLENGEVVPGRIEPDPPGSR